MHQGRQHNEAVSPRRDAFALVQWLGKFCQFVHACRECQQEIAPRGHAIEVLGGEVAVFCSPAFLTL